MLSRYEVRSNVPTLVRSADTLLQTLSEHDDPRLWLHHVAGAARLIEIRGPDRFLTDFEISLFVANIGPVVMEAFLDNKACFLTEDRWEQVLRLAVFSDESLANQRNLAFDLWSYLLQGPKLFRETTDIICGDNHTPTIITEDLIQRLAQCRVGLLSWLSASQRQEDCGPEGPQRGGDCFALLLEMLGDGGKARNHTQLTLRGTFIMCLILKTRLLYSLAPSRFPDLEEECQTLAAKIVESEHRKGDNENEKATWTSFMSQSVWIAKGILETKSSWCEVRGQREGVIEKWKFEAWCKAIGRKCP